MASKDRVANQGNEVDGIVSDIPQWAVERARELAALWNDPGQEDAIARALAEAAKPKWNFDMEAAPRDLTDILVIDRVGKQTAVCWLGNGWVEARGCEEEVKNPVAWMPLPTAPEVE